MSLEKKKDYEIILTVFSAVFEVPYKGLMWGNVPRHRPARAAVSVGLRLLTGTSYRDAARIIGKDLSQIVRYKQDHEKWMEEDQIYRAKFQNACIKSTVQILRKNGRTDITEEMVASRSDVGAA